MFTPMTADNERREARSGDQGPINQPHNIVAREEGRSLGQGLYPYHLCTEVVPEVPR